MPAALRQLERRYRAALLGSAAGRRIPELWSPLEYVCHVRDVLLVQRDRIVVTLNEDGPNFKPMYRDQRVQFYAGETASGALGGLGMAAELLAAVLERLSTTQLDRSCIYSFPSPRRRDVRWVAQHTMHEAEHHLLDIERQ